MFNFSKQQIIAKSSEGNLSGTDLSEIIKLFGENIPPRSFVFLISSPPTGPPGGHSRFIENKILPVMPDPSMDSLLLKNLLQIYNPEYIWLPESQVQKSELWNSWDRIMSIFQYVLLKNIYVTEPYHLNKELALLLTTSGSTGSPKFVKVSYKNIKSNACSIAEYLELTDRERPITSLPMHYSYGLSVINSHLIKGATILLTDKSIMEKDFWTFFKEQEATSIAGVPYTYQMLKRLRVQRMELPSLRTLTQAGGKLSPELVGEFAQWAKNTGRRFVVMYGQTEATARMSYLPWDKTIDKSSSIGVPIPGGDLYIIGDEGEMILEPNVAGELIYRGDNVTMGYAETVADLYKDDENEGVLHTGDIAQFDEEGYFYIVGRLKRFVKIFGNRINLDQTEQIAKQLYPECACIGTDDKIIIYVTDADITQEMRSYISVKLGIHSSAIEVKVIDEIPKNSSGKVQYSQLVL